ncbi:uncharacterized protein LOC122085616 [Macadamia integrifolia]|uniref:uncharacterized protein LOC122085616 n=1 Tax=Macadamia integrifolia TaxID=60698 RepID=UPI001C4F803F|nr:uncharacterized protein LOC122085616 [Macadamia integrifolia]XP_042510035.1 uncharacterized protein LOC122085616 [Macadamia integrifolia]XP_042510036.1 uncharacterized protein LOC122085616 [Macadamia integrifolia]XP_042510038.1 uncharacterized protein LOC122085616 [Macadamia integrifolia]
MGLLGSLAMLLSVLCILCLPGLRAESHGASIDLARARSLDVLLQDYAYRAFNRPRTGIAYDGKVPSNLTGITISAMRLRRGSLRRRGVNAYKEFDIPTGVVVEPYVERLVLVYQNLGNWSAVYYPLPGYSYLAPVVGLLSYDASNLSATNLPELGLTATGPPISISFSGVRSVPGGSTARCVMFDLQGMTIFSNVSFGNVCSSIEQGHFGIVIESTAPSPAPVLPPPPSPTPAPSSSKSGQKNDNKKWWKIVGSSFGSLIVLSLLLMLVLWVQKYMQRKDLEEMENISEFEEALQICRIGATFAPMARSTRTPPVLESEIVP